VSKVIPWFNISGCYYANSPVPGVIRSHPPIFGHRITSSQTCIKRLPHGRPDLQPTTKVLRVKEFCAEESFCRIETCSQKRKSTSL